MIPRPIPSDETVREAYQRLVASGLRKIIHFRNCVLASDAIEERHDLRSEIRRFEALIKLFQSELDMDQIHPELKRLQKLRKAVGKVRELDLTLELVEGWNKKLIASQTNLDARLPKAISKLTKRRGNALEKLAPQLDSVFRTHHERKLARAFLNGITANSSAPLGEKTDSMVRPILEEFASEVNTLRDELLQSQSDSIEIWHPVRIAGRRLRYALETKGFSISNAPEALQKELRLALRDLQTHVGGMLDKTAEIEFLRPLLNGPSVHSRYEPERWEIDLRSQRDTCEAEAKKDLAKLSAILERITSR